MSMPVWKVTYRDARTTQQVVRYYTGEQDDLDKWCSDLPATFIQIERCGRG